MDVHTRDLRIFLAVADHLHISRAAEELFLSQPAVSRRIRTLEHRLRTPLFVRHPHGVRLTPAGEALRPHARSIIGAWDEAATDVSLTARGTLVVGLQASPGRGLLPAVRAQMAAECPDFFLELRHVPWDDPTAGLGTGAVDAAFAWLPLAAAEHRSWITVAREDRRVALPVGHPLADLEAVPFSALVDEPVLALPPTAGALRDLWLGTEERAGHPARVAAVVSSSEETYEAVAAGLGVCLVPEGATPLLARDGVTLRPVAGLAPAELVLTWDPRRQSPAVVRFVEVIRDLVRAGLPVPCLCASPS